MDTSSNNTPIQHVRAVDQVTVLLRNKILDGTYPIGSRLPAERTLAQDLGINRLTLRAALSHLEAEGLLHAHQGRGITICDFHQTGSLELLCHLPLSDRLAEVLSLRQVILTEAVGYACAQATTADLNRLRSIADQQARAANDTAFFEGDHRFFTVLVEATQNLSLRLLFNSITRITQNDAVWQEHLRKNRQQAIGSYHAFIALIKHRNVPLAKKTLMGHLSENETVEVTQLLTQKNH